RGPRHGRRERGRTPPEPGRDLPVRPTRRRFRSPVGDGGFSKWKMGLTDEDSYATQLAGEDLQIGMVVAVVRAFKQTEDAHREALTSPFFHARLAEMPRLIAEMERSEEHTSELQSRFDLVCRHLLEKKRIAESTLVALIL